MWAQLHTRDSRDISDNDVAEKTGLKNYASLTTAFTTTTFTIKILAACHHWDSESFGTVQTGYCLKVFPEDRGWQVYFESIGLNFFGWFLLSTLSLFFALPTFHRTLGWGSIPRQWICDNHAFVQFDVELNISCTNGAEEEFLRKIDLFQSDAGRWNKDISLGRGGGTSLLQSAPFPIDSHYKESLRRGLYQNRIFNCPPPLSPPPHG